MAHGWDGLRQSHGRRFESPYYVQMKWAVTEFALALGAAIYLFRRRRFEAHKRELKPGILMTWPGCSRGSSESLSRVAVHRAVRLIAQGVFAAHGREQAVCCTHDSTLCAPVTIWRYGDEALIANRWSHPSLL